jgi:long-subunit fatty acid transport protein
LLRTQQVIALHVNPAGAFAAAEAVAGGVGLPAQGAAIDAGLVARHLQALRQPFSFLPQLARGSSRLPRPRPMPAVQMPMITSTTISSSRVKPRGTRCIDVASCPCRCLPA